MNCKKGHPVQIWHPAVTLSSLLEEKTFCGHPVPAGCHIFVGHFLQKSPLIPAESWNLQIFFSKTKMTKVSRRNLSAIFWFLPFVPAANRRGGGCCLACCSVLQCTTRVVVCCSVLHMLQCVAVCCGVWQCVLRCVIVCCQQECGGVLQSVPYKWKVHCNTLQHVQYTATHCNTLCNSPPLSCWRRLQKEGISISRVSFYEKL